MPVKPLTFGQPSDVTDLLVKLEQHRIIDSEMSSETLFDTLMRQLLVTTDGQTYLLDDILKMPPSESRAMDNIKFAQRNLTSPCNFRAARHRHDDILFNAPLAKALTHIYTTKPLDPLSFPLPVYEFIEDIPAVRPAITNIAPSGLLFSEQNVYEYQANSSDYIANQALDDLAWLRFQPDSLKKSENTELLLSDIKRMQASIKKQLEQCATEQLNLNKELAYYESFANPSMKDKSTDELRRDLNDSHNLGQKTTTRNNKLTYTTAIVGTIGFMGVCIALPFILPFTPALIVAAGLALVFGASVFAIEKKVRSRLKTDLDIIERWEKDTGHTLAYKKIEQKVQAQVPRIKQREDFYKSRLDSLWNKEKSLSMADPELAVQMQNAPSMRR